MIFLMCKYQVYHQYHPVYPVHTNASAAMGEQTSKTTSAETGIILKQKIKTLAWLRLVQPHTIVLLMLRKTQFDGKKNMNKHI